MKGVFNAKREKIETYYIQQYTEMDCAFHFQTPIELLLVRRGTVKVWINDTEATIQENELAVAMSLETHRFASVGEGDYTILFVSPHMCPSFMEVIRHKNAHDPIIRDPHAVQRIAQALDILDRGQANTVEEIGYIHVILGTLLGQIELEPIQSTADFALPTRLFAYINEHYREELTVSGIAQAMGYDRHYLSQCFRSHFQMSIGAYINTLRLKDAVTMMCEGEKTVTECAMESGFGSMRTFYRVFAEEFGCAPRDYLLQ